jgi:outer membrane lipoprotein-sorting protein
MGRGTAWLLLGLSCALCSPPGIALAQDTVIEKSAPAAAPDAAAPQVDPAYDAAAPVPGELNQGSVDEGAGWDAAVEEVPGSTPLIGPQQDAAVQRINDYFNNLVSIQGNFDQVDSNNKHTSGRFYVQRPGKLRFDYAPPSTLRLVADGHFLAIEDSSLKTVEKYPIESTPFRLLLGDGVDLGRDSRIVGVEADEDTLAITLEDKAGKATGQIKLYFDTKPEMMLKQWVITDAQGLATTVTISDVAPGRKVAADFFTSTTSFQPFR